VHFQPGNWDKNAFGSGFDVVLMSNIMHGTGSEAAMKLGKAFKSLDAGGLLIVHDFVVDDEGCGPLGAALFKLVVGSYRESELKTIIAEAGFTQVKLA